MEEENKIAQETYRKRIEEQKAKERERMEQNKHNHEQEEEIIHVLASARTIDTQYEFTRRRMHPKNPDG